MKKLHIKSLAALLLVVTVGTFSGRDARGQSPIFGGDVPRAGQSLSGIGLPNADIYGLGNDGVIWQRPGCGGAGFVRPILLRGVIGQPIGIDFRPADGKLYLLDDLGQVYTVDTFNGRATLATPFATSFAGGVQSLMDFNPVLNALRLIGSNDQNFALVNSGGNLNLTVVQTSVRYALGDLNTGLDPNLVGGAYTNNFVGAGNTIFFALDFNSDKLVTIQPATPGGSSATGGGQLQTVGPLVFPGGQQLNITPTADVDIYTFNGVNTLVGFSGAILFTADLAQVDPNLPLGQTQPITIRSAVIPDFGFIDLAVGARRCSQ
jgi:hypothetical protein